MIYFGWKGYQKSKIVTDTLNTNPKINYISGLIRKTLFSLTIIAFILFKFKLAVEFFLFYLLLNFVEIRWKEKWKYQLTKNGIKKLYNKYIDYLTNFISNGIDQIKNSDFLKYFNIFLDLFVFYQELKKRKKQTLEDTKVPPCHKGINEYNIQKISTLFTKRLYDLDFEIILAQIISSSMYTFYSTYLILNNGGIKDLSGYTNLEWCGLIEIIIFGIFISANKFIRKKHRKAPLINGANEVWLTKQLNIEIERNEALNDWINLIIILVLAILFAQFLNYFINKLIGFILYLLIFSFLWLCLSKFVS